MAHYYILLCLSLLFLHAQAFDTEKSVGPVVMCSGPLTQVGTLIKNCYHRCISDPEPSSRESLSIHQIKSGADGPKVLECSKVKQTQVFTQTWTFSTVKGPVMHEYLPVTTAECEDAIKINCPSRECNHREKDNLEEEYHYASDTVKVAITISLLTMSSSLQIDNGVLKLSPLTSKKYVEADSGGLKEDGKIYTWDSSYKLSECPFEPVKTYACDVYKGSDSNKYYICAGGRFTVTAPDNSESKFSSACSGLIRSVEGFIYGKETVGAAEHSHSRLAITALQNMGSDADYLRHKVQQISTHLDSEICHNQCELLSLEVRINDRDVVISRLGLSYYKIYKNSTAQNCLTLHGCRMSAPQLYCGNPPRIGVVCTENNGLWDPTSIELVRGGVCLKPDHIEKLTVSLGSKRYSVDDGLMIHINRSDDHGIYTTSFSDLHQSRTQFRVEDLDRLKPEWSSQKEGRGGLSKSILSEVKINSPSFSVGAAVIGVWKSIQDGINTVEHIVGGIVIFIVISMLSVMFWKIWITRPVRNKYTASYRRPSLMLEDNPTPTNLGTWT